MVKKTKCDLCGKDISNSNFNRHRGSKSCLSPYLPIEQEMNEDMSCIYCSIIYENTNKLRNHQLRCQLNPEYENRMSIYKNTEGYKNRKIRNQFTKAEELGVIKPIVTQETREKMSKNSIGKKVSDDIKKIISDKMKKAHREGRAWNIGKSRWNNQKSYPEKYFTSYFLNELEDIDFETEFPVGNYSLDFAWNHKKKCIEIDGEQHYRFQEYIDRDKRKEKHLEDNGWELLRIRWTDYLKNKEKYKLIIIKFIDG